MSLKNSLVGRSLISVRGSVYFIEYTPNVESFPIEDIIDFYFVFNDFSFTVQGSSSGDKIVIRDNNTLHNIDMDNDGYIKVLGLLDILEIDSYVGLEVCDVQDIVISENKVGISIIFSEVEQIIIINLGDELFFFKELPEVLVNEGYRMISI